MALFRRLRRRGAGDSETQADSNDAVEPRRVRSKGSGNRAERSDAERPALGLEARLTEIANEAAPEDALEQAVQVIAEECGATATALCLFDVRQSILRLATEFGLSDEGCKKLRRVRRGDPSSWDMPLLGLLNRRAYLIERASQNRYVPTLIDERVGMGMVACVPLYSDGTPLGSVILVTPGRNVNERDVQALTRCFPILVRMVSAVRRRAAQAPVATASRPRPPLMPPTAAQQPEVVSERDRLRAELADVRAALEQARREGGVPPELSEMQDALAAAQREAAAKVEELARVSERLAETESSLSVAETSLAEIRASENEARAELTRLSDSLQSVGGADGLQEVALARQSAEERAALAEKLASEREAELGELGGRLDEAEAALAETRTRESEAREEIARLETTLKAAAADGGAEEFEAARADAEDRAKAAQALAAKRQAEIDDLQQRLRDAEAALQETKAQAEQAGGHLESQAAGKLAELEGLEARLAEAETALAEARAREEQTRQELEELRTELHTATTNDSGRREQLEAAKGREEETREQLEAAQTERDALRTEHEALQTERERLETGLREAAAARDQLAGELESLRGAEEEARNRQSIFEQEMAVLRSERDKARASVRQRDATAAEVEARVAEITAERDQLAARIRELEAAASDSQGASSEYTAVVEERDALRAEREGLVSDRDALAAERDALSAELETLREGAAEEVAASAAAIEEAETDDGVTVIPVGDEPVQEPPAIVPGRPAIVVLDGQPSWGSQTLPEHQIVALRPDLSVRDHVAAVQPERLMVNLAAPGSLQALAALRANGCTTRAWGCFVEPGAERGLALGLVEPAIAPLDPDAVIDALGDYAVRGARVMTTGVDVDGLMSVRQALSRRRVSVSMAWDRKQAGELLSVVRPHAVLIDLDLPRDDGYGILCELAAADPVPFAVILGSHEATSPSLESLLAASRGTDPTMSLREIVNALSTRLPRATPDEELRSKRRGPSRAC